MAVLSSPLVLLQSIPPVTRAFTAATILSSGAYAWLRWKGMGLEAADWMLVVPGSALFHPWTLVTSMFVETTIIEFIISIALVPPSLKYLERLWGSVEIIKFIVVSIAFSNIIAFAFNWIEFMATGNADLFLFGMEYHGQMALQTAILVAFTQLIPEYQVQIFGVIKTRVKSLPMAYLTLSTVLCFIGFQSPWIIIQFGWFVGWIYLRFYKKHTSDAVGGVDTYGDRSETFSLVSWFPPFLQAMALKALDQRVANSSSPAGGAPSTPTQSSRASQQGASGPVNPSQIERQKSVGVEEALEKGELAGEN
ncbi:hypothetical protein H0H92_002104 [Tricholoma furcatifolium]|nr:hypothetical protein H0H92_002104 [Tricholoma furcatifolium]